MSCESGRGGSRVSWRGGCLQRQFFDASGHTMDSRRGDGLQIRLQRVERHLRIIVAGWMLSVTMLVVLGAGMQHAISQPMTLRARAIQIVDAANKVRARLGIRDDGNPALDLLDSAGTPRAILTVSADSNVGLLLGDVAGKANAQLSVSPKGDAQLLFYDASATLRAGLSMFSNGLVGLGFYGDGKSGVAVTVKDGMPNVNLANTAGSILWSAP